jgi:signal transduction histidine kinase
VRTRVTVVAGLALTAAVVLGLVIMYLVQRESARRSMDSQLRTYATQIAQSAQDGAWPQLVPPSTLDPNAQAQVLAADGSVLAATRSLQGLPAVYALPPGSDTPVRQKAADGVLPTEVRVAALRTTITGQPVTIITGTSTGFISQVNETFARLLLVGLPGILILAAGTVWLVVGRALRPVEKIRQAVTAITAADLSRRVPEPGTRDEVGHLAQTMNDMLARLEDSATRQRRFVVDASHELRSPLAAIRTTLEVGLAHPDKAPWPAIAQRAVRQSTRLEDLVDQLLLVAKTDDRQLAAQRRPVELDALLAEVRATTAVAHHLHIEIAVPPDAVTIGNPGHLARMFRNILDNAIRYAENRVLVAATATAETVQVEISDDGPGIPVAERERVFDRFVRLDTSREHTSGSTGLGLSIAKEIAIAHGGHIAITEARSGGTRVVITLPRPSDSPRQHQRVADADDAYDT